MAPAPGPNDRDNYGERVFQHADLWIADGVKLVLVRGGDIQDGDGTSLIGVARTAVLANFADDAAAAAGGVAIGQLYRTASAVKVRVA